MQEILYVIKIVSLIYCLLKLITSLLNEILLNFINKIIKDKVELDKVYQHIFSKMSDMYLSFDKLKIGLNDDFLHMVSILSRECDTPFKIFIWSLLIFYEKHFYDSKFIPTKNFKTLLFSLTQIIYSFGKKYTTYIYDEIVYDKTTIYNTLVSFINSKYIPVLQKELKKLDYINFCRFLIDHCRFIEGFGTGNSGNLLYRIRKSNVKLDITELIYMRPKLLPKLIQNVVANL